MDRAHRRSYETQILRHSEKKPLTDSANNEVEDKSGRAAARDGRRYNTRRSDRVPDARQTLDPSATTTQILRAKKRCLDERKLLRDLPLRLTQFVAGAQCRRDLARRANYLLYAALGRRSRSAAMPQTFSGQSARAYKPRLAADCIARLALALLPTHSNRRRRRQRSDGRDIEREHESKRKQAA